MMDFFISQGEISHKIESFQPDKENLPLKWSINPSNRGFLQW